MEPMNLIGNTINESDLGNLSRLLKEGVYKLSSGEAPVIILFYPLQNQPDVFQQNCFRYRFTSREIEIAELILKRNTQKDIAITLHISNKTVAKHLQNIYYKLKVNSKMELINKLKSP